MLQFAAFQLDQENQRLRRNGDSVYLTPKAFQVLSLLVLHAGRIVTTREIFDAIWPAQHVDPSVLKVCILEIRKALGDNAQTPIYIATERGRGYRFQAAVAKSAERPVQSIFGRAAELGQLSSALMLADAGTPHFVLAFGEPGIGKSALVRAWGENLTARPDLLWLHAQCIEHLSEPEPYYPILDALRHATGAWDSGLLGNTFRSHAPSWLNQMSWLQDTGGGMGRRHAGPGYTREQMLREMATALGVLAAERTLVIVLEDIHWSDRSTLDLLSWLANERGASRLLTIATYRTADAAAATHPLQTLVRGLAARHRLTRIQLGPLDLHHIRALLAHRYPGNHFPEDLGGALHQHAGGNPLFVLGILNDLSARGLIEKQDGRWITTGSFDASRFGVPEDLKILIHMLLGRLEDDERKVLEAASVAGVEFLLSHVAEPEVAEAAEGVLEQLARRALFVRSQPLQNGIPVYRFLHSLFREVLYDEIPGIRKQRLHLEAGKLLEKVAAQDPAAASQLANHFERGGAYAKAIRYWMVAARVTCSRCAQHEALVTLRHAQDLCARISPEESRDLWIPLLEQQGIVHHVSGEHGKAAEVFEAMLVIARKQLDVGDELMARLWLVATLDDRAARLLHLKRAAELQAKEPDPVRNAAASCTIAFWDTVLNGWSPRPEAESVWRVILSVPDRSAAADCGGRHAFLMCLETRYSEAIQAAGESARAAAACNRLASAQVTRFFLGWALLHAGQWGRLGELVKESLTIAQTYHQDLWRLGMELVRAWLYVYIDAFPWALPACRKCEALAAALEQHQTTRQFSLVVLGEALTRSGDFDGAQSVLDRLSDWQARERLPMDWIFTVHLQFALTELNLRRGCLEKAAALAQSAITAAQACPEKTWQGLAHWYAGRVCSIAGDSEGALEQLRLGRSVIAGADVPIAEWRLNMLAFQLSDSLQDRSAAAASAARLLRSFHAEDDVRKHFLHACEQSLREI